MTEPAAGTVVPPSAGVTTIVRKAVPGSVWNVAVTVASTVSATAVKALLASTKVAPVVAFQETNV